MLTVPCPFCHREQKRVFHEGRLVLCLWDGFPVSPGHALIVTRRHVADWFEASEDERHELMECTKVARRVIEEQFGADGFNIGINVGATAGQTIPHLHVHVIPRRTGDVTDPRGGVRFVIPGKANYLAPKPFAPPTAPPVLLTSGGDQPLFPLLGRDLEGAKRADIAVSFVMPSGIARIYDHLSDLLARGGELRLLTGDYLDITDPDALQELLDLKLAHPSARIELRVFVSASTSFHPKAYIVTSRDDEGVAYVGSSNLSRTALGEGIEWNYRVIHSRDREGFSQVVQAFENLFRDTATRSIDSSWLNEYRQRRKLQAKMTIDVIPEPPLLPPEPHAVQREALEALETTRVAGYTAGLVVLATGLGKTWLAAFDSARPAYRHILFVAHREEILQQAMRTFRRIRPGSTFGHYNGVDKAPEAEILFASIQTLGRYTHLSQFAPDTFDYIVVDEFHHASAATYRRLIRHFTPKFLLGLTATPERTDGADLLQFCQENLVFRRDLPEGIRLGLLSPFRYFGVPDDLDYQNIPWRSSKFDEEMLTNSWTTTRRAENALEQWRKFGGGNTLSFCVSKRHADFMRDYFLGKGIPSAAVHSGESSDPRTSSLERLASGDLQVLFAVDMFNEGVDIPTIDTIMMLRPTESRILWLQQLGRGLRKDGDRKLNVIDYIGNHRIFLLKARTLLQLPDGDNRALAAALDRVQQGKWELPPGCEVTYELEAINILRGLLPPREQTDALKAYYEEFRERNGVRPTASEAFHDNYQPRSARNRYGSWFRFVDEMGDLLPEEATASKDASDFLQILEITEMTRSYKMLVLLALLNTDTLPGYGIRIEQLVEEFRRLAERNPKLKADVGDHVSDDLRLRALLEQNPIDAWVGGKGTGGVSLFEYSDGLFRYRKTVPETSRSAFQELVRELAEWRLAEYLSRPASIAIDGELVLKVSHANGRPILFLPDRKRHPEVPSGWQKVTIDGNSYTANFAEVALNVVRKPGDDETNELPALLRKLYGSDAGLPGTRHLMVCERREDWWELRPQYGETGTKKLRRWSSYAREQIPSLFGETFSDAIWNSGFIVLPTQDPKNIFLLVTLKKDGMAEDFHYLDHFLGSDRFQWQSQNQTKQSSKRGKLILNHESLSITVHLFVRTEKRAAAGSAAPFVYCGPVRFESWEGEKPITVRWTLSEPVPDRLRDQLQIPQGDSLPAMP